MRKKNPVRWERVADAPAKMKWSPTGKDVTPWKRGFEVSVKRSMPRNVDEGKERSNIVGGIEGVLLLEKVDILES